VLADPHPLVRYAVRTVVESHGMRVVGDAADGREAVQIALQSSADLVITELAIPVMSGIDAARTTRGVSPETRFLLFTASNDEALVLEAWRAGISAYVLKNQSAHELLEAISKVCSGGTYLSPGVSRAAADAWEARGRTPADPLSPREREVLRLVADGKSTKEVAMILGIGVKTADSHRTRLMGKLDIHDTATLTRYALRRGLVEA
jgi:two-component system response regulator NreC